MTSRLRHGLAAVSLPAALASGFVAPPGRADTPPAAAGAQDHVRGIATTLSSHLPRVGEPPPVRVVERSARIAGLAEGAIEISTGLLQSLGSDAELAMIVAYEQCRALPSPARRASSGASVGAQIGRAAAVGAATGVVVEGVHDALGSSRPVVRGAATGAATASTAVAVSAAFGSRRGSRSLDRADDLAAADGMRALVAAGWDGARALVAWDRVAGASVTLGEAGGYADPRANARRREAAARALRASGQRSTPRAGYAVGEDAYRAGVLARLAASASGDGAAEPDPPPPATGTVEPPRAPADGNAPWVVYHRSGGFTGWAAELRIYDDGTRWVSESQRRDEAGPRPPLAPDVVESLRRHVQAALARPPRQVTPEARHLRDGMLRSIEVRVADGRTSVSLSDGLVLTPEDHELVRKLEAALR